MAFSGNAPPQLALTRRLVERGHEVRVLAHRAASERVQQTGADFVEFHQAHPEFDITKRETDSLRDWEARTKLGASLRLLKNAMFAFVLSTARECAASLQDWPAEAVVFDWMFTGAAVAAESAGLPAVALVHCPYPLSVKGAPPLFSGMSPMSGPAGRVRDGLLSWFADRGFATGLPLLNKARAEQGLGPLPRWDAQLLGAQAIYVMTAPELDFASQGALPANVRYVGPAFEPFTREWASPWPAQNTDPLVLVSFSTSYMNQGALVQRVLDALAKLPVRVLLTSGPALDVAGLRVPANTHVEAFIPHRTVLPHASLVISHAGWQTINAALADGVPLVCIPDGRDQPGNAARVVSAGAGVRVGKGASPKKLRGVIAAALEDPEIKRNAEVIAAAQARSDGALTIAEELERLG
jgi:UDP:flavonoid glycosyltransferase YjiC (YdhE family)